MRSRNDLDRELRYHMDRRVVDLVRSGLAEWEARRQATLELGGLAQVQEEVRDVWLTRWLRDFVYDLRFSARSFLRSRSFAATTVLSLALGIGATTAIYSLVDQVILHALPVREPAAPGPHRLEGRSGSERVRQLQSDVVPDLPRPSAPRSDLRRCPLSRGDDRNAVDGRRAQTRGGGDRLGDVLFSTRRGTSARQGPRAR